MQRIFVAIDLPQAVRRELAAISSDLPGARWVKEGQVHLTLRFIGEVEDGVFQDIREALTDIKSPVFSLQLVGLGFFPPRKPPHILWVGVEPVDPIVALRNRVESLLVQLGLEPEGRKFSPHVTLARLRDTPAVMYTRYLADNAHFGSSEFRVDAFCLYSSILTRNGAIHQLEATYPLT